MLTTVLNILSIIGWILLILLGIILFLILIVLFWPIFYKSKGQKQDEILVTAKASWLFGLVRVLFRYPEPGNLVVKILFFTVYDTKKEVFKEESTDEEVSNVKKEKPAKKKDEHESTETAAKSTEPAKTTAVTNETVDSAESHSTKETESVQSKIEKIKFKLHSIYDNIKDMKNQTTYYKEVFQEEETRLLLRHALKRLKKILKSIRPRKLKVNLLYGTGSPDSTGYLYALYGMLCSVLGKNVIVIPDFENAILKGDYYIAGHITVFHILWNALMLVLDKKTFRFIKKMEHKK